MAIQSRDWDPQNLNAGFKYDPKNYDPTSYAKFKEARAARDKQSLAKARADLERVTRDAANAIKEKTAPSRADIKRAAKAGHRLTFNGDSTCFASLSWESDDGSEENGTVTATFQNGYGPYTASLDLDSFLEMTSGSAGKFFNHVLGQDFFAG